MLRSGSTRFVITTVSPDGEKFDFLLLTTFKRTWYRFEFHMDQNVAHMSNDSRERGGRTAARYEMAEKLFLCGNKNSSETKLLPSQLIWLLENPEWDSRRSSSCAKALSISKHI